MKRSILLIFAIFQITISNAQQFSCQMNFVDAIGNKDSLILGYDIFASDTIDPIFGETNIIANPVNTGLDVRQSNIWWRTNSLSYLNQSPYQTKTQITKDSCFALYLPVIEIDIISHHFPITAYWDHSLFQNACLNGSILTSVSPLGWWDTGGFQQILGTDDSISFSTNQYTSVNGNDTASVYWVAFSDSTILLTDNHELAVERNSILIYPNPADDFVSLNLCKSFGELDRIEFYNSFGRIVMASNRYFNIDISGLPAGLYFIKASGKEGETVSSKLLKLVR